MRDAIDGGLPDCAALVQVLIVVFLPSLFSRDALWAVLARYNIPQHIINILRDLHTNTQACVRADGEFTDYFPISSGVRQGCIIAPLLFNIFMDFVMRQVLAEVGAGKGIEVAFKVGDKLYTLPELAGMTDSEFINLLMYADDVALICTDKRRLVHMLSVFEQVS